MVVRQQQALCSVFRSQTSRRGGAQVMSLFRTRPFRQRRLAQKQVRACGDARKLRTRARVARIGQCPSLRLPPNAIGFDQMHRADKLQRRVSHPEPQPVLNNMRIKHIVGAQLGPCPRRKARREQRYPGDGLAAGPPGLELIFRAEQVSEMIKMQMADGDQVKRGEIDVFLQLGKAPVPHIEQYPSAFRLDQKTGASAVRLRAGGVISIYGHTHA